MFGLLIGILHIFCLTGQVKSGGGGVESIPRLILQLITAQRAISVNRPIYLHNVLFQVETREKMLQQLQTNFDSLQQHRNGLELEINRRQQQVNQLQEQLLVAEESSRNLSSEVSHGADRLIMTHVWA